MKKIIIASALILQVLAFNSYAGNSKCEDYHQAIIDNCNSGTGGISSGSMGACFGAQLGAWIAGC
ncbi:hypothetical protein [Moellerella wisconsensis]|uniref:Uncharacterized protein n=1 Tax=Moellerella wisconsensis ATCC 35017 TaxID=1354267 RepID=A0A0N1KIS4_9GAMM|nr:hypothetical protein [Moellerella wisconsensis]KPD02525.1 hypothetical protein M992_1678 [Moellerella wisconsensis ATCC 35017]VFS48321.1 ST-B [Moellerella wisconsensis]